MKKINMSEKDGKYEINLCPKKHSDYENFVDDVLRSISNAYGLPEEAIYPYKFMNIKVINKEPSSILYICKNKKNRNDLLKRLEPKQAVKP